MMWFWIKVKITQAWCKLTGAHAVYVKDMDDNSISVKVMRVNFDPFVDQPEKQVYIKKYGYKTCHANGEVSNGGWRWRYVNEDLHVQHKLSN
jgi:hypothetical protein